MDFYYPDSTKLQAKNPWMLFTHGGGWAGVTKEDVLKKFFRVH